MRIAFLCQSASSGHSYVSKNFIDALSEHEIFVFATGGTKETDRSFWKGYNTTFSNSDYTNLNYEEFADFLNKNKIELLFLNEWNDWELVRAVKETQTKVALYLDWFNQESFANIRAYVDLVFISAEHAYEVFVDCKNCHFIPWGIDTELFKPGKPEYDFFHSAGWGGINFRKCTPEVIRAFHRLGKGTMLLHTQTPHFDTPTKDRIRELRANGRLKVKLGKVDHPGLYHKGRVYVGPSKLEGLGLYIPEALACGLPVITTNKFPMSQFVEHGYNGILIDTVSEKQRGDGYFFPEYKINEDQLLEAMRDVLDGKYNIKKMSKNAREFILREHDFETVFKPRVKELISKIEYWEYRYSSGFDAGEGSQGKFKKNKSEVINKIIKDKNIKSILDIGCGEGSQSSEIEVPEYLGVDISPKAIERCRKIKDKRFEVYVPGKFKSKKFDATMSLDVIYHLVGKGEFEDHIKNLFSLAERYVIIYSTDYESEIDGYIKHRKFTEYIDRNFKDWNLTEEIQGLADCKFYIYKKNL